MDKHRLTWWTPLHYTHFTFVKIPVYCNKGLLPMLHTQVRTPWVLFIVAGKSVKQPTLNVLVHSFTDSKISFTIASSFFFLLSVPFRLYRLLGSSFLFISCPRHLEQYRKLWLNFSFTKRSLEKYLMHTEFRREREIDRETLEI